MSDLEQAIPTTDLKRVLHGKRKLARDPVNKALCSVLGISLETSSDVPAVITN